MISEYKEKKLFLLDAMALIYRAHFAFIKNPRINSKGVNTSAIFGFTNSLLDILEKEKPTHIAVAFDTYAPTVRHADFTEYKANRDKQPEDITYAIPVIKKMLEAFKIPAIEVEGYEADDLIGTLAKKAQQEGFSVYMFTPDKDFAQLVDENIFIYKPSKMGNPAEVWDAERVKKEFGIKRIEQVVDIQGLMGDAVDNIPGVPGIGPKNAQKLIEEFDTIENLLKNTEQLREKQRDLIRQYADQALLSKKLATIITDIDISFDEHEFLLEEPDKELLENLFAELEFRNLSKRILGKEPEKKTADELLMQMADLFKIPTGQEKAEIPEEIENYYLFDLSMSEDFIKKVSEKKILYFYNETSRSESGLEFSGMAVSDGEDYLSIKPNKENKIEAEILLSLKPLFEDPGISKTGYDLKTTITILRNHDIGMEGKLSDVLIAHYLVDSESRHDLDFLTEKYLNRRFTTRDVFENEDNIKNYWCEKCAIIKLVDEKLNKELDSAGEIRLYREVEVPLIRVLADMEAEGIRVDPGKLNEYSLVLSEEINELEKDIFKVSGVNFNINSPLQLGRVLFEIMKLDPGAKKTSKTKQYSTSEEVLQKLANKHMIARKLLDYRSLQKLKSTYVEALPALVNPKTGRIHTSFNQAVTATGRLSSTNPNLQNIPIRTERGRYIRKAFVPRSEDYMIMSADYSQIELRIIADISGDESMMNSFKNGIDIHQTTAAKIYDVPLTEVTPEMRRKAKVVNFGIIYGISGWGLAQRLDIARKEGEEMISHYFTEFPQIRNYMDKTIVFARENGYVSTLMGRRRIIREINSRNAMQKGFAERNAINAPIQGSAADLIKIAMVNIQRKILDMKLKSRMILQVHDELVFDMAKSEKELLTNMVKREMENAMHLKVPLVVDIGVADNWLDAH